MPAWTLQVSHGRLDSPEALEPEVSMQRTTASASYQHNSGSNQWQTTMAWGRNRKEPGTTTDGWLLESAFRTGNKYTFFGRLERVENVELFGESEPMHGQAFKVGKLSLGAVYDFARFKHTKIGVGALVSRYSVPAALHSLYGSDPMSFMVFIRARLE